jgi:hypothetical protein
VTTNTANLGVQKFGVPVKVNVMHFLFPLLFSQIIVLHQLIAFPPHYFFILFLVSILPTVQKSVLAPFLTIVIFLLMSSLADNAYREAFQILLEMVFGYVIARFFIERYSSQRMQDFFKRILCIWAAIVVFYMCDFYFFGRTLNGFSQLITNWESGGTSTVFARISILWGNPNWLSFFYLIAFALYVEFNGRNVTVSILATFILFVLQTKTAIALGAFLLIFVLFSVSGKRLGRFVPVVLAISIISLVFSYWSDIARWIENLQNFSSFINRQRIWEFISPFITWHPNGLMGDGTKLDLVASSDEDSLPSILLLLRLFGWPIVLTACLFFNPLKKNNYLSPVTFVLLGYSMTQSYLSISASCSLAFFAFFIFLWRRNTLGLSK